MYTLCSLNSFEASRFCWRFLNYSVCRLVDRSSFCVCVCVYLKWSVCSFIWWVCVCVCACERFWSEKRTGGQCIRLICCILNCNRIEFCTFSLGHWVVHSGFGYYFTHQNHKQYFSCSGKKRNSRKSNGRNSRTDPNAANQIDFKWQRKYIMRVVCFLFFYFSFTIFLLFCFYWMTQLLTRLFFVSQQKKKNSDNNIIIMARTITAVLHYDWTDFLNPPEK